MLKQILCKAIKLNEVTRKSKEFFLQYRIIEENYKKCKDFKHLNYSKPFQVLFKHNSKYKFTVLQQP